ncbi:hypothetical protein DOTSEDRAFT_70071 [Dothistroma septosporum NZE10]|uniref:Protein phosphatase 4 core regulatory subunit R2 n=1 Tax=Dothistroma septosporum (strain NZE10 / CBS 128990) TaxID=675120 RepID=N1PUA4_DOTSN|nr:hypothetical protein DOTSEDRAFT_70071 [Dothistroma septosporum NZE10]
MISTDQILEGAAHDGSISLDDWVNSLQEILQRLHDIVHTEFPIPALPLPIPQTSPAPPTGLVPSIDPEVVASTPPQITASSEQDLPDGEGSSQKENVPDAPMEMAAGRPPEISESQRTEEMQDMAPPVMDNEGVEVEAIPGTLPPDLLSSYQMSRRVLEEQFSASPPYTVQRLAELILRPKRHYRYLPAYLRALDRVISVSSPVSDFPLPTLHNSLNGGFLSNGEAQVNGINEREGLGSDESLGGALLTPIPWLRNQTNILTPTPATNTGTEGELHSESTETIEGPLGAGSIETVSVTVNGISSTAGPSGQQPNSSPITSPTLSEQSDASTSSEASASATTEASLREQGGVTQGELLRQEQEAGVVPVNPHGHPMTPRRTLISGGAAAVGRDVPAAGVGPQDVARDEEQPHARGPETIGMEDMGPQPAGHAAGSNAMLDMEAAVGRGRSKSPQSPVVEDEEMGEPGAPGQDPKDVEKEVERLKEEMDKEAEEEARDGDGDVVVADVDGKPTGNEVEEKEGDGDVPDAVDASGQ